jgi:hypothetical protein
MLSQKNAPRCINTDVIGIVKIMETSYAFSLAVIINFIAGSGSSGSVENFDTTNRCVIPVTVCGYAFFSINRQGYMHQCQEDCYNQPYQDMIPHPRTLAVFHLHSPLL